MLEREEEGGRLELQYLSLTLLASSGRPEEASAEDSCSQEGSSEPFSHSCGEGEGRGGKGERGEMGGGERGGRGGEEKMRQR